MKYVMSVEIEYESDLSFEEESEGLRDIGVGGLVDFLAASNVRIGRRSLRQITVCRDCREGMHRHIGNHCRLAYCDCRGAEDERREDRRPPEGTAAEIAWRASQP